MILGHREQYEAFTEYEHIASESIEHGDTTASQDKGNHINTKGPIME